MIYSYIITGPIRYAEYALISAYHLIKYGGVKPSNIYITTPKNHPTSSIFAFRMLEKLEVNIRYYNGVYNKLLILDELFDDLEVKTICQIDCDCIWMGEGYLTDRILNTIEGREGQIVLWDMQTKEASSHLKHRSGLLNGPLKDSAMYAQFINNLYGFSIEYFKQWLDCYKRWIWGGLMFVNREYRYIDSWNQGKVHAQFSPCEETVLMLNECYQQAYLERCPKLHFLQNPSTPSDKFIRLTHEINPTDFFLEGKIENTFVHFAGDHYRVNNDKNRQVIEKAYQNIVKELL